MRRGGGVTPVGLRPPFVTPPPPSLVLIDAESHLVCRRASLFAPFANGILKDKAAVSAAITEPWSNGQVEGQINKLKLVKRQMYGRAKLDLLQARLIGAM